MRITKKLKMAFVLKGSTHRPESILLLLSLLGFVSMASIYLFFI